MKKYVLGLVTSMILATSAFAETIYVEVADHTPNGAYRKAGGGVRIYFDQNFDVNNDPQFHLKPRYSYVIAGPNFSRPKNADFEQTLKHIPIQNDETSVYMSVTTANSNVAASRIGEIELHRNIQNPVDQRVLVTITEFDPATKTVKGTIETL